MSSEEPDLAENPDEVEELPDDEIASEALQTVLEEMSSVYAEDNERIPVNLAGRSAAHPDGDCVYVNPDLPKEMDPPVTGANILRLVDDLLAHEVAHINWTNLRDKQNFAECYPGWGKIPGFVNNVMEDEYVDAKRKKQWYGMRSKLAYYVWLHMNTEHRAPPVDEVYEEEGRTQALMTAFFQTALAGYINGDTDAIPGDILEFCSYADILVKRCRHEDDPDERFKLCHAVMQLLMRYVPDPEEFDPEEMDDRRRESAGGDGEGEREPDEAPEAEEPTVDLPPEIEAALEELMEELFEEGEMPEMPEPPDPEEVVPDDEEPESEGGGPGPAAPEHESDGDGDGDSDGSDADGGEPGDDESDEAGDGERTDSGDDDDAEKGVSRDIRETLDKYTPDKLKVVN